MSFSMKAGAVALGIGLAAVGLPVDFFLWRTVDLSATAQSQGSSFIGSNPSAVHWNGSSAWVGGYNGGTSAANTGIVRVDNVLGSASIGSTFGAFSTSASRGITGLTGRGTSVFASLDNGAGSGDSVRAFDGSTGALSWRIGDAGAGNDSSRRGNGVAIDPGFGGSSVGVAYMAIGSGRRHRLDPATGVYVNGQNAGAIVNFNPVSTTWRDLAFDPSTGDLYTRESNRIGKAVRNGDNTFTGGASALIGGLATATAVDNQNIAFLDDFGAGTDDYLIVNDRTAAGGGQVFTNVVKVFNTNGVQQSISFRDALGTGTATFANGNGAYDFSYDSATNTLAVTDYANRQLYIFGAEAVPEPGTMAALGLGALALAARRRRKQA